MKLLKLTKIILGITIIAACSRDQAAGPDREFGPQPGDNGPQSPQDLPILPNSLQIENITACARLESLRDWARDRDYGFSFLREIHPKGQSFNGGLDIGESPFVQLFFGEKFAVMSPEEFLKTVEAEYQAGKISWAKYQAIQLIKGSPTLLLKAQLSATNGKLEEGFPGVFGNTADMKASLHLLLMGKASAGKFSINQHAGVVTARLPLFISSDWSQFTEDARLTLSGVIKSVSADGSTPDGTREKLCGLVLWQRQFAQLLSLKGYQQPELFATEQGNLIQKRINKLSSEYPEFKKVSKTGAFADATTQKSIVLSAADIPVYDPSKKTFLITAHVPTFGAQSSTANFSQMLSLLEGLAYMYAATSPAAPWVKKSADYVMGDVSDPKAPNAIVPADAHSLALGLMRINLKNLAKFHVVQLNAQGAELQPGQQVAGFIPMESKTKGVSLQHVIQLTRIAVVLDQALGYFKNAPPETWAKFHPVYDRKTLAALLGDFYLPKAEVEKLLSKEELETVLKSTLVKFRLPLASLLMQMGAGKKCVSHLNWDLKTGARKPTRICDANEAKSVKSAIRLLALHVRSPLLYKKSLP